jgi:hypothetical protein
MQPIIRKVCQHCNKEFTATRKSQKYCSRHCSSAASVKSYRKRKASVNDKKWATKYDRFKSSPFASYLIRETRRAGTVQVLSGNTAESLLELFALTKQRTRFSGYEDGKPQRGYELSHIQPVKQKNRLGLLHPLNLVISPASFNRTNVGGKTKSISSKAGMSLPLADLQKQYVVLPETSDVSILKKIQTLLGEDFKTFVGTVAIAATQADQLRKQLAKKDIETPPWADLSELKVLAASADVSYFSLSLDPEPEYSVLLSEVRRFGWGSGQYRPYVKWLQRIEEFELSFDDPYHPALDLLTESLVDEVLHLLHGYPAPPRRPEMRDWILALEKPINQAPVLMTYDDELDSSFEVGELAFLP